MSDEAGAGATAASVDFVDVCARYGRVAVLDHITLSVSPGEVVALTGSNGSGKSTLVRCLLGLHPTSQGRTLVDREAATDRVGWHRRRREVAYVPQRPATGRFPLLVRELLASSGAATDAEAAADELGVGRLLDRPVDTLSGGQLQRCVLARGLGCTVSGARVLVADEPTSALDFDGQEQVARLLASLPVTVLVVTHEHTLVSRCTRVVEMAGGRLREGRRP